MCTKLSKNDETWAKIESKSATTKATVRDLWAHKDMPAATGSVANTTIKPHGSQLLLLTEAKEGQGH